MEFIYIIGAGILGFLLSYLFLKSKYGQETIKLSERNNLLETENSQIKDELNKERDTGINIRNENATTKANYKNLESKISEQKKEFENLQQKFAVEFENLANRILEEKSSKFTEQNRVNLNDLLIPLGDKIKDFEKKVNDIYVSESKERASLSEQLRNLQELNRQMSEDASNLTKALKGDTKKQGAWGEFILEKILESSGLTKDREYVIQTSYTDEDGKRQRPDVIINLPENKHLIIDSKVSLKAYERFCSSDDEIVRNQMLFEHIGSIRTHIKGLSQKAYQNIYGIDSMDFVLLFIPIEPAFALAVQNNPGLFDEAFEKNIVIVCPSTLLATLRTVANIWRQEKQNVNALEIAKQSGDLYDKFVGFTDDLIEVGKKLDIAKVSYSDAMKKLTEGRGNLVSRAENIKQLGAKTTKSLPQALLDRSNEDSNLFNNGLGN